VTVPFKKQALLMVLAFLALAVLTGHQTVPPMDRDESRFAQASRQMVESGDLVTIRFQDELRAKKPAGIYWLQSASAAVFGTDDIASYRLPSLLAMLLTVIVTYRVARTLYNWPRALLAAAACGGSLLVFAEAHLAKTDSVLMLLCLMQQWGLMRIYQAWQHCSDCPTIPISGYGCRWQRRSWSRGRGAAPALTTWRPVDLHAMLMLRMLRQTGFLILAGLTLPWAILVTLATDGAFLDVAFRGDFVAKAQSGQESHGAPVGTYLLLAGILLWPLSLLIPRAATQLPLLLQHVESRFLLAWVVPFWLLIEFVPTKLPHYPMPLVPALVVLLVCAVDAPLAGLAKGGLRPVARRWLALGTEGFVMACGPLMAAAVIWAALTYGGVTGGRAFAFAMLAALMAGLAGWQALLWHRHGGMKPLSRMLAAGILFNTIVVAGLIPSLSRVHLARAIEAEIAVAGPQPAAMAAAGIHEPSLVFEFGQDLLLVDGGEAALFLAEAPDGLAIVDRDQQQAFLDMAASVGLSLVTPRQVEGFNMSKGKNVLIFLYRADGFDRNGING